MDKQNHEADTTFKEMLEAGMERISSITISTKNEEPVIFHIMENGGFYINGDVFIDLMFRDPEKTRDRLVSYMPDKTIDVKEDGDDDE